MAATPDRVLEAIDLLQAGLDKLRASVCDLRLPEKPPVVEPTRLVGLKQAARHFNVHERTMRRHAKAGAGMNIGGAWRVDVDRLKR